MATFPPAEGLARAALTVATVTRANNPSHRHEPPPTPISASSVGKLVGAIVGIVFSLAAVFALSALLEALPPPPPYQPPPSYAEATGQGPEPVASPFPVLPPPAYPGGGHNAHPPPPPPPPLGTQAQGFELQPLPPLAQPPPESGAPPAAAAGGAREEGQEDGPGGRTRGQKVSRARSGEEERRDASGRARRRIATGPAEADQGEGHHCHGHREQQQPGDSQEGCGAGGKQPGGYHDS